jgi:hypothetical protein
MGCVGCKQKTIQKNYDIIIEQPNDGFAFLNIYQNDTPDEYLFYGILSPNVNRFHLVFKKQDEERLPLAISFEINDEHFLANQYQFLKHCFDKKVEDLDCVVIQFPNEKLTNVFCCDVSPSFPFPVEISGCIKLSKF